MIGDAGGMGELFHIWEVVTQGDPLEMFVYNIGLIYLIRDIQEAHTQPHNHVMLTLWEMRVYLENYVVISRTL